MNLKKWDKRRKLYQDEMTEITISQSVIDLEQQKGVTVTKLIGKITKLRKNDTRKNGFTSTRELDLHHGRNHPILLQNAPRLLRDRLQSNQGRDPLQV